MAFIKDINFFNPKSKPEVKDGEVARQEIALLLNTRPTEKPFDSNYGVDYEQFLFDLISYTSARSLYFEVINKIKVYVKTVEIDTVRSNVVVNSTEDGYDIILVFKLKNAPDDGKSYSVTKRVTKKKE